MNDYPLTISMYAEVHDYGRNSTGKQDRARQDYTKRHDPWMRAQGPHQDVPVYDHYDDGWSGYDRSRPALNIMKARLRVPSKKPRLVRVTDLARLFRHNFFFLQFVDEFIVKGNTQLYIMGPGRPVLLCGNNLYEDLGVYNNVALMMMMAQIERMNTAERTKAALAAKKARGETLGRPRDTSRDQEILDLHYKGESMYKTAKILGISYKRVQKAWNALALNEQSGNTSDE